MKTNISAFKEETRFQTEQAEEFSTWIHDPGVIKNATEKGL